MLEHEIQTGLHRRKSWESAREEMGGERNQKNRTMERRWQEMTEEGRDRGRGEESFSI